MARRKGRARSVVGEEPDPDRRPEPKPPEGPTLQERIAKDCAALCEELASWGVTVERAAMVPSRALLFALRLKVQHERSRGEHPPCFTAHAFDASEPACLLCDLQPRCGVDHGTTPDALLAAMPARARIRPWPCDCGGLYAEAQFDAETGALRDFVCPSCSGSLLTALLWQRPTPAEQTVSDEEVRQNAPK